MTTQATAEQEMSNCSRNPRPSRILVFNAEFDPESPALLSPTHVGLASGARIGNLGVIWGQRYCY